MTLNWPSNTMKEALSKLQTIDQSHPDYNHYSLQGNRIEDETEKRNFAKFYIPIVNTIGYELRLESKSNSWGGVQYDLLSSTGGEERVLQVILIWTKQRSFVTFLYSMILTIIAFLGILIFSSVKDVSKTEAKIAILLISIYLIGVGIKNTYDYYRYDLFSHRISLFFVGILFLIISIFDFQDKFQGKGIQKEISIWTLTFEIYLPYISIFLIILLALRVILRLFERFNLNLPVIKKFFSIHEMDYTPIWIYLRKINEGEDSLPENWRIKNIYYDKGHYSIGTWKPKNDEINTIRPPFEIRNTWHSINIAKRNYSIIVQAKCLLMIFVIEIIILYILFSILTIYFWGTTFLMIGQTFIFIVIIASIYIYNNEIVFELVDRNLFKDTTGKYFLSSEKLEYLWNIKSVKSRLKIIEKLNKPFDVKFKDSKWD